MIARFHALAPDYPPGEYENTFTNARGEVLTIYWRAAPVQDAAGRVVSIVSGGLDITERRKRELELERERDATTTTLETIAEHRRRARPRRNDSRPRRGQPARRGEPRVPAGPRLARSRARRDPVPGPGRRGRRRPCGAPRSRPRPRVAPRMRSSPSCAARTGACARFSGLRCPSRT